VGDGLFEVLHSPQLLVRLPEVEVRLPLLGRIAARTRRLEALLAALKRAVRVARGVAARGNRLVPNDKMLIRLLGSANVRGGLREVEEGLVLLYGGGWTSNTLMLVPPLTISELEMRRAEEAIAATLETIQ
jgi:acetylornithine/succinyldiaminopimelate/putrescine aminotransferase